MVTPSPKNMIWLLLYIRAGTRNQKFLTRVVCRAKKFGQVAAGASFQLLVEWVEWQNSSPRKQTHG